MQRTYYLKKNLPAIIGFTSLFSIILAGATKETPAGELIVIPALAYGVASLGTMFLLALEADLRKMKRFKDAVREYQKHDALKVVGRWAWDTNAGHEELWLNADGTGETFTWDNKAGNKDHVRKIEWRQQGAVLSCSADGKPTSWMNSRHGCVLLRQEGNDLGISDGYERWFTLVRAG